MTKSILQIALCGVCVIASAEVTVNNTRVFTTNNNTQLLIDDQVVTTTNFSQNVEGMSAEVQIDEDVNADVTSGTAKVINAENQVKGPVTNLSPLQVLGQDVAIDAGTLFANSNGTFALGDLLKVSGSFSDDNVLLAGRIEATTSLIEFKLVAQVSAVNANLVQFGNLVVDTTGVALTDCSNGIQVGELVELKAAVVNNFDINTSLNTVSDFECKSGVIILPVGNNSSTLQFSAEGFVSLIIDASHFELNGQVVEFSAATVFENGTLDDLATGVKLEAEGSFDVVTNLLAADKIKFRQTRVRITAPATIADLNVTQVTLLNIDGQFSALSRDQDDLIPLLSQDFQIELRGYLDSGGILRVDRIRERGVPDANDIRLRGPVSNFSNPDFQILGVAIDVTGASFFIGSMSVDNATFFASLNNDAEVDVNHGVYDVLSNTSLGGEITLEEMSGVGLLNKFKSTPAKINPNSSFIQADGLGALGKGRIDEFLPPVGAEPVALVASTSITANEGSTVALDGSSSTGDTLSFAWTQTSGPAVTIVDPAIATTSLIAPQVSSMTTLMFNLTVTDAIGNTDTTTVTVTINDTTPPPPAPSSGGGGSLGLFSLLLIGLFLRKR